DSIDRSVDKRKEAPRRFAHPGAVWDLDVGPSFPRHDVLGKGLSHRSVPAHEAVDLLTGNLSQEYPGGIGLNTLGHSDLEDAPTPTQVMRHRDKHLYGSPGTFNYRRFDMFLFDEADDPATPDTSTATGYQTDIT